MAKGTQSPAHPHSPPETRELSVLQSLECPPSPSNVGCLERIHLFLLMLRQQNSPNSGMPDLASSGMPPPSTAHGSTLRFVFFNIKAVSLNRTTLLEIAKVKTGSFQSLCWVPRPPSQSPTRKNHGYPKSTSAYEILTVCQAVRAVRTAMKNPWHSPHAPAQACGRHH